MTLVVMPIFSINILGFLLLLVDLTILPDLVDFTDLEEPCLVAYDTVADVTVVTVVVVSGEDENRWLLPLRLSGGGVAGTLP